MRNLEEERIAQEAVALQKLIREGLNARRGRFSIINACPILVGADVQSRAKELRDHEDHWRAVVARTGELLEFDDVNLSVRFETGIFAGTSYVEVVPR